MALAVGGNNTRANLLAYISKKLNDPNNKFFDEAFLIDCMLTAFQDVFIDYVRKNPEHANAFVDFTYTASTEEITVSLAATAPVLRKIVKVEDRTTHQPGPALQWAHSFEDQHEDYSIPVGSSPYGGPLIHFRKKHSIFGGVITETLVCTGAPIPTSDLTLRLHYQSGGPDFVNTSSTSGLPPEAERLAVIDALIDAKFREVDIIPPSWVRERERAEARLNNHIRSLKRGPKQVRYTSTD